MPLPMIHYIYPSKVSKYLRRHANGEASWAVVTGASDGIGRALCSELSVRGFNIVLHGRNPTKLEQVAAELRAAQPTRKFRTFAADATSFTTVDLDRLVALVADIPVTVLINNVGGTAPLANNFMHFEDFTPYEMQALYSLNVQFALQVTNALLPQLQRQRGPTAVVTCSSLSQVGQPYAAAYSGCKAALHAWSRGLAAEMRHTKSKVEVVEVVVGATYTQQLRTDPNFSENIFMPSAEKMAGSIIKRMGNGHVSVVPYFWHAAQAWSLYALLPAKTADSMMASILVKSVKPKGSFKKESGSQ